MADERREDDTTKENAKAVTPLVLRPMIQVSRTLTSLLDQTIKPLSKDASFFGKMKPIEYIEPAEDPRDFYFYKSEVVVFHADGKILCKSEESGETELPAHVGVTIIRGRCVVEERKVEQPTNPSPVQ